MLHQQKGERADKSNYRQSVYLRHYRKYLKSYFITKCIITLNQNYRNTNAAFEKGFSAHHCLIVMIERWELSLDNKCSAGVLLTDLYKAFDCMASIRN